MAKKVHDDVLDAGCNEIAESTRLYVCSAEPADFADIANVDLAEVSMTAGAGNGDYTVGNGDTNGRKVRALAQSGLSIHTSGTATHVALADFAGSRLLAVTTCPSQALTSGGTVDVAAFDAEFADPT